MSSTRTKTSLYLPFTKFTINNKLDGQKAIYETIVESGPVYKLIVHECPEWLRVKDEVLRPELVEIIPDKKADEYKQIVNRFFSPITEARPYYVVDGRKYPMSNLTMDHRRALSYLVIAHDYKARICEDDILKDVLEGNRLSTLLEQNKDVFSEEALNRVRFVEELIKGYQKDTISTLSVNKDTGIFNDLMDLLDSEEIRTLSEENHLFSIIGIGKDMLKRKIKELVTRIVQNKKLPYLVELTEFVLSYIPYEQAQEFLKILPLVDLGLRALDGRDFRDFAPAVESHWLFKVLGPFKEATFSYEPFNWEFVFRIEKRTLGRTC